MRADQAAAKILTKEQIMQLQQNGIEFIWASERDFLLWAANSQEQHDDTYKKLDKLQQGAEGERG